MTLDSEFFRGTPTRCARDLIGCRLDWKDCSGVIVETEAYEALGDQACHTHVRPTARQFIEDHEPGTAYVYLNYGVHWLFNLLVKGGERDGFVLFRALEPVAGLEQMRRRRRRKHEHELCSGPGKLTQALGIDGSVHGTMPFARQHFAIFPSAAEPTPLACRRIGISSAKSRKWRFLRKGSPSISVRPRAE